MSWANWALLRCTSHRLRIGEVRRQERDEQAMMILGDCWAVVKQYR